VARAEKPTRARSAPPARRAGRAAAKLAPCSVRGKQVAGHRVRSHLARTISTASVLVAGHACLAIVVTGSTHNSGDTHASPPVTIHIGLQADILQLPLPESLAISRTFRPRGSSWPATALTAELGGSPRYNRVSSVATGRFVTRDTLSHEISLPRLAFRLGLDPVRLARAGSACAFTSGCIATTTAWLMRSYCASRRPVPTPFATAARRTRWRSP
jgi:hypothetical protein